MSERLILMLLIIFSIVGCNNNRYSIYSSDKKNCITIITEGNARYIISGDHNDVPVDNFIKLDLTHIDREAGDEIVGCWNKNGYKWIIFNDKAIVIENRLDTTKYNFKNKFPVNRDKIPSLAGYVDDYCFDLGFSYSKITHKRGDVAK